MADITVNIDGDGGFSPSSINPNPGETVTFAAEDDTVLCVEPASVFGENRFEIAAGTSVSLAVQADAAQVDFSFSAVIGSLDLDCVSARGKDGGGRTGG